MILLCNFEEVTALTHGARAYLDEPAPVVSVVAALSVERASVESLLHWLSGDHTVHTLMEQRAVEQAMHTVVEHLRAEVDARVVASHAASEEAVAAYFDFAHALTVLERVREMGDEMAALVEVMTGAPPDDVTARRFVFPD